ncbi:MAG: hypothetical protein K9K62_10340 [Desulfobacteraceae bacterium]|nr:hypothetical protein [Desulfobacteraceae bacterium]
MDKSNKTTSRFQFKAQDPKEVDSVAQRFEQLSDNDKGMVLRKVGVTYLQSRWRPLIPTPELRPVINMLGRLSTLINLVMRLFTSRKLPVEDLSVISETRIREDVVEPVVEILQAKAREIEAVLDTNKENSSGKGKEKKENKGSPKEAQPRKSEPDTEEEPALEASAEPQIAAQN